MSPGGSGYFICIQNMKSVTNKYESGGLHEKHVVAMDKAVLREKCRRPYRLDRRFLVRVPMKIATFSERYP